MTRRLVLIDWIDSHSGNGWQPVDEIVASAEPIYCRSVGWLIADGNGVKVLVPHLSGERNENVRHYGKGDIAIPNKSIVKIRTLKH